MTIDAILSWVREHVSTQAHLHLDSRSVAAGDVFIACQGTATDGRSYIAQAVSRRAKAVLVQAGGHDAFIQGIEVPLLVVDNLAQQLGQLAHEWYGRPSEALSVVAVTGTNGKTSVVNWIAAALASDGVACGTIGTLGVGLPDGQRLPGALTTPDVVTTHRSLAAIRDAGASVAAIEASSIGLDQGRLDHVAIAIAGFTNLTRDHLDYHGTTERYAAAKGALFNRPGVRRSVLNIDDAFGAELAKAHPEAFTYSLNADSAADIRAGDMHASGKGMMFNLLLGDAAAQVVTGLVGQHNVANVLLVAGVLRELGWSIGRVARALCTLAPVDGRLQVVEPLRCGEVSRQHALVVVDYAHTPDALQRALLALREITEARNGKLVCVFGCGGDRDRGKRPLMGAIAAQLADKVIVTSDNPRSEDPAAIIQDIVGGMPRSPQIMSARAEAILDAVWQAQDADVILIAGKGHESYQETAGIREPFDDRIWSRLALTWLGGIDLCTDSRKIAEGQMFLALKGELFDGRQYLEQVRQAGACAAIVEQYDVDVALPQFEVGDTRAALTVLGAAWRRRFLLPAIAVTGSNGKTTTKEMVASILRAWQGDDHALATSGNLNNDIGVPLTLLRLRSDHKAAVFELGMNHPGEIAGLAAIAAPTVALVNNAQREHQEFLLTVDAVARENGAVISALSDSGVAVFPGDDAYSALWRDLAAARRVVLFGLAPECDVTALDIHPEAAGTTCRLRTPDGDAPLTLGAPGLHNLRNALAAAACAHAAGAPLQAIVQGLQSFSPVAGRMNPSVLPDGMQLIDDSYNANPDSVRAAIDVLAGLQGRKVLVLGDMAEVGNQGPAMHVEVGVYAHERGIDCLLAHGPAAAGSAQAFGASGQAFDQIEDLVSYLVGLTPAHILVKGSRSARMERVVQGFRKAITENIEGDHHAS